MGTQTLRRYREDLQKRKQKPVATQFASMVKHGFTGETRDTPERITNLPAWKKAEAEASHFQHEIDTINHDFLGEGRGSL